MNQYGKRTANKTTCGVGLRASWLRPSAKLWVLAFLLPTCVCADGFGLAGTLWERVATRYGLDPVLLYAVGLVESAHPAAKGTVSPWPWTLNVQGTGVYFLSHGEALAELRSLLDGTGSKQIDVGLMQINLRWNGWRVTKPEEVLDPYTNIDLGARILAEALASAPEDMVLGIGRYHSHTRKRAYPYGRKVMRVYAALNTLSQRKR